MNEWQLTPARAAIHLPTATAVVSDLHLGYAETRRRGGDAVPVAGVGEVLAPLRGALAAHAARRLVIAGDLFEAGRCRETEERLLAWLREVGIELVGVVLGNHDRGLSSGKSLLPLCESPPVLGRWRVVHGDGPLPEGPVVQGHLHPCLRLSAPRLSAPCYLLGERNLLLPAYSADAAGVSVLGGREWGGCRCYAIAGERVLDFGELDTLRRRVTNDQ